MWVREAGTKLWEGRSMLRGKAIMDMPRGFPLRVLERVGAEEKEQKLTGRWARAQMPGIEGWVFDAFLSPTQVGEYTPPADAEAAFWKLVKELAAPGSAVRLRNVESPKPKSSAECSEGDGNECEQRQPDYFNLDAEKKFFSFSEGTFGDASSGKFTAIAAVTDKTFIIHYSGTIRNEIKYYRVVTFGNQSILLSKPHGRPYRVYVRAGS